MQKLTVEVDLDLEHDPEGAAQTLDNLICELEDARDLAAVGKLKLDASGLVLNPLEDDELVGNWRID